MYPPTAGVNTALDFAPHIWTSSGWRRASTWMSFGRNGTVPRRSSPFTISVAAELKSGPPATFSHAALVCAVRRPASRSFSPHTPMNEVATRRGRHTMNTVRCSTHAPPARRAGPVAPNDTTAFPLREFVQAAPPLGRNT